MMLKNVVDMYFHMNYICQSHYSHVILTTKAVYQCSPSDEKP